MDENDKLDLIAAILTASPDLDVLRRFRQIRKQLEDLAGPEEPPQEKKGPEVVVTDFSRVDKS